MEGAQHAAPQFFIFATQTKRSSATAVPEKDSGGKKGGRDSTPRRLGPEVRVAVSHPPVLETLVQRKGQKRRKKSKNRERGRYP